MLRLDKRIEQGSSSNVVVPLNNMTTTYPILSTTSLFITRERAWYALHIIEHYNITRSGAFSRSSYLIPARPPRFLAAKAPPRLYPNAITDP